VPTKLFGLVTPEEEMLDLTRRSDNWIRRDLEEKTLMELQQHKLRKVYSTESPEHKALSALYRYPFQKLFKETWSMIGNLTQFHFKMWRVVNVERKWYV
jgi:hypothetical protein